MGTVCHDCHTPDGLLDPAAERRQRITGIIKRLKQVLLALRDLENPIIIANDTAQIHRDDGLGVFRDGRFQRIIVHLRHMGDGIAVLLYIHKHHFGSAMDGGGGGGRVGIRRNDDFVSGADAENAKVQFLGSR